MGFQEGYLNRPVDYPTSLVPLSQYPIIDYPELPCYYSSCSLVDIRSLRLCRKASEAYRPIIGMVVQYNNNRSVSVGQSRLDWMEDPIDMRDCTGLGIVVESRADGSKFLANISKGVGHLPKEILVPWEGTLIWWFSHNLFRLDVYTAGKVKVYATGVVGLRRG